MSWRGDVESVFRAALHACEPDRLAAEFARGYDFDRFEAVYVIGWGKAAARMAVGIERVPGLDIAGSLVLSTENRDGRINVRAASHPFAEQRNVVLTHEIQDLVLNVREDDLLVCLCSGGGSAMLCDPVVPLDEYNDAVRRMMRAGADIRELNAFRRAADRVKGGRLGAMCKGDILNLVVSDVIDGGLWDVASGPTVTDESGLDGAGIAGKYGLSETLRTRLLKKRPVFDAESHILADNRTAVLAALGKADALGLDISIRDRPYTGEAAAVGELLLEEAGEHEYYLAGGEATVTVSGDGVGGRNQHLCLGLHEASCDCFSAGTDGMDGTSKAAGAFLDDRSRADDWKDFYDNADSATFFARSNSQLITGATGTNVCDITILKKH